MITLRERKKRKTKENILLAAHEIFLIHGFEKTTIAKIANKANIGTGTFYNYFSSKSELFLVTFWANPEEIAKKADTLINNPGDDVIAAVINLINLYMKDTFNIKKEFWQEIFSVFMANIPEQKNNMKDLIDIDFQIVTQLEKLFGYFKQKGYLTDSFNPTDAAQCIYGIWMVQLFYYIYDDKMTLNDTMPVINRQIRFFFTNKVK